MPVEAQGLPGDGGIGVEVAAPQPLADYHHGVGPQTVPGLFMRENTAQQGLDPHHLEVIAGNQLSPGQARSLPFTQREGTLAAHHQAGYPL